MDKYKIQNMYRKAVNYLKSEKNKKLIIPAVIAIGAFVAPKVLGLTAAATVGYALFKRKRRY